MTLTRQQKIEAIGKDFLDRDQDAYVKIRRSGRLGWESLIPAGGNYSDLLRDCRGTEDLVKEAYCMARDYIVAMDTPYRVTLRLSPEANCTDSKVVYLATRVFDDADLSEGQKVDTFVGLAIHEGCHLKWTDFTQMASEPNGIVRNLINVLEDERIERNCGEAMPGYANFLKATKYYMFDLYRKRLAEKNAGERPDAPVRLLNAILAVIRYPKALDADDLEEFAEELYDVRETILDYPETPVEVTSAAHAIYEIIKRYFEKQQEEGKKKGQESGRSGSGEPQSGEPGAGGDAGQTVSEALSDLEEKAGDLSGITSNPGGQEPMGPDDMAECVQRDSCRLAGICENTVDLGQTSGSVLYRAPENAEAYDESLRRVRKYVPAIAKTLRGHCTEQAVTYRGMRSGALDTCKLAEAFQGVQTVYLREGAVKSDRMAVCVLMDESGSMYGEKIRAARDLGVLLNEAVSSIPSIDLYIYGHTYGDRCKDSYCEGRQLAELQVYREKGYAPRKALGSVEARSGNLDSFAIREAAARMRKFSACGKNLMFVVTDGAPNERCEQLSSAVKQLEKSGMDIVAVCIEPSYDPASLYTHHVRLTDMGRLAIDLGKMIKKAIMKNAVRRAV